MATEEVPYNICIRCNCVSEEVSDFVVWADTLICKKCASLFGYSETVLNSV